MRRRGAARRSQGAFPRGSLDIRRPPAAFGGVARAVPQDAGPHPASAAPGGRAEERADTAAPGNTARSIKRTLGPCRARGRSTTARRAPGGLHGFNQGQARGHEFWAEPVQARAYSALPVKPRAALRGPCRGSARVPAAVEIKIWRASAAGALARASGGAGSPKGGGGRRRGGSAARPSAKAGLPAPGGGGGSLKSAAAAISAGGVGKVTVEGETVYLQEIEVPMSSEDGADSADPYAAMPGGGSREATDLLATAGALSMKGRSDEAQRCYRAILARFPNHYTANYNMGIEMRLAGRPRSAVRYLRKAISVWPENPMGHAAMGRTLLGMGKHEKALAELDIALVIQPEYEPAIEDRDEALRALGRRRRR